MNTIGNIYRLTCFGESHGPAIGGVIDGIPSGISIDICRVQEELDRRAPGNSKFGTARKEPDRVKFLSGIFDGKSTGTPIGFAIENTNARSGDYDNLKEVYRPCHADFSYDAKYSIRDFRGGGRSSARATAPWVVAGAIARQALESMGISIFAFPSQIGNAKSSFVPDRESVGEYVSSGLLSSEMVDEIEEARKSCDTVGGIISCYVWGMPAGIGEPLFGKLQAQLAHAMLNINAAKGFEYGDGFASACMKGSESVDTFYSEGGRVKTHSNHSGGIQGGISNGETIRFRVAFKPIATLPGRTLETVDRSGQPALVTVSGRHDPCPVPRAVPIVEALTAIVVFDSILQNRSSKL